MGNAGGAKVAGGAKDIADAGSGVIRENLYGPEARQKRREAIKVSFDKVLKKIREIAEKSADGDYIYRGEPKCYDKVSSSLYRQYKDIEADGFDIEVVQKELLKEAKQYTHQTDDFEIMSELQLGQRGGDAADVKQDREIMSELQHYGGKTNLIDFTTDYLIALFFACDGEHNENGRVILLQRSDDKHIWRPQNPANRVKAQKSIFFQPKKGFIKPDDIICICIPKDLKGPILTHLIEDHSISTETIYNDLHGFITTQRIHQSAYTEFFYGVTYREQHNNEKAIKHYGKAIELKPDFAEAYNNRGNTYGIKGNFKQAIKDYNEAIKLKSDFAKAYYNRGIAYAKKGNFKQAIKDFNEAIDRKPDFADAYNNRGSAYSDKSEFDQAIQDFNEAIELEPDYAEAYCNRGNAYSDKSDFDQAIQDYNEAIKLKLDFAGAYNNRGIAYVKKGNFKQAIKDFNEAIDRKPDFADAYNNRGNAYSDKGNFDQAMQDFDKAIELKPDLAGAYFNRGCTWLHLGEWEKAKADLTTAKNMRVDIADLFRADHKSVADFERKYDLELPEDIADMLAGETV